MRKFVAVVMLVCSSCSLIRSRAPEPDYSPEQPLTCSLSSTPPLLDMLMTGGLTLTAILMGAAIAVQPPYDPPRDNGVLIGTGIGAAALDVVAGYSMVRGFLSVKACEDARDAHRVWTASEARRAQAAADAAAEAARADAEAAVRAEAERRTQIAAAAAAADAAARAAAEAAARAEAEQQAKIEEARAAVRAKPMMQASIRLVSRYGSEVMLTLGTEFPETDEIRPLMVDQRMVPLQAIDAPVHFHAGEQAVVTGEVTHLGITNVVEAEPVRFSGKQVRVLVLDYDVALGKFRLTWR